MTALHLTLHAFPAEPAISLASRIAMRHGIANVSDLIHDLRMNWQHFRNGQPTAVRPFAEMVDVDPNNLIHVTFTSGAEGRFGFRGHLLDRPMVNRRAVRVCPRCILDDHERGGSLARCSRSHWQLTQFRICPVHGLPIHALQNCSESRYAMDVAQIIDDNFADIQGLADAASPPPNGFESWLKRRLDDEAPDQ